MIWAWIETSSADTASSQTMKEGFRANARAMPMRCRCPPENSCGYRFVKLGFRPTSRSSSWTRRRRSWTDPIPKLSSGSWRMSPTVIRGSKDAYGSWKIICIFCRIRRSRRPRNLVMSWPSKVILPAVTGSSAVIKRARVDFPQPDSPTRPSVSPRRISRSTPSTARTASPPRPETGKYLKALSTRSRTASGLTAVAGAFSAACNAANLRLRLQLLGRLHRQGAGLGRIDVLLPCVAHEHPAARHLVRRDLGQRRLFDLAAVDDERAAGMKFATCWRVDQVWRQATNRDQAVLPRLVDARHRAEQRPRVWMLRAVEDLLDRTFLDDATRVHHDHPLAQAGD